MQIFPTRKSDAEYVEFIRKAYANTCKWKWLLAAIVGVHVVGAIVMVFFSIRMQSLLLRPPVFPGATFEMGYGMGFVAGFVFAFGLPGATLLIVSILTELRTWRLLLDYHDRLERAELLGRVAEQPVTEY